MVSEEGQVVSGSSWCFYSPHYVAGQCFCGDRPPICELRCDSALRVPGETFGLGEVAHSTRPCTPESKSVRGECQRCRKYQRRSRIFVLRTAKQCCSMFLNFLSDSSEVSVAAPPRRAYSMTLRSYGEPEGCNTKGTHRSLRACNSIASVSYTHLTLPTICSV